MSLFLDVIMWFKVEHSCAKSFTIVILSKKKNKSQQIIEGQGQIYILFYCEFVKAENSKNCDYIFIYIIIYV